MSYFFTSESVSEGHPDKIADQVSDSVLDAFLIQDSEAKVACETLVTTGLTVLAGEVKSNAYVDLQLQARKTIANIGYTKSEYQFDANSCGILSSIHEQSADINRGVDREDEEQGAGDQGIMFGYATDETESYMPLALQLSHMLLIELAELRRMENSPMPYLRPDAKSQVTIQYSDDHQPERIEAIVLSTQHDDFDEEKSMLARIKDDVVKILIPRIISKLDQKNADLFGSDIQYHVNPTGKFVIGGPHGDAGLTGRKIIVDTYGGRGAHGGGAFSGKDPSKVDRSAAYAARHIAKNAVAAGLAEKILIQVSYAIGVAEPTGVFVDTYGTAKLNLSDGEIASKLQKIFDLKPAGIIDRLKLKNPIYGETAKYGHFGREPFEKEVSIEVSPNTFETKKASFFTWEKLDFVEAIQSEFGI
ncbi:MAG: methionine adenosyltransferase [Flavobacteriales bacterium]|jgi:S-adenosylmethionine synthetase|nr:methionine adenosyltransferase [Flavobacteriales bacterium]